MKILLTFVRNNGGYVPISNFDGSIREDLQNDVISYATQVRFPTAVAHIVPTEETTDPLVDPDSDRPSDIQQKTDIESRENEEKKEECDPYS